MTYRFIIWHLFVFDKLIVIKVFTCVCVFILKGPIIAIIVKVTTVCKHLLFICTYIPSIYILYDDLNISKQNYNNNNNIRYLIIVLKTKKEN
jgi:hypothetical protein